MAKKQVKLMQKLKKIGWRWTTCASFDTLAEAQAQKMFLETKVIDLYDFKIEIVHSERDEECTN